MVLNFSLHRTNSEIKGCRAFGQRSKSAQIAGTTLFQWNETYPGTLPKLVKMAPKNSVNIWVFDIIQIRKGGDDMVKLNNTVHGQARHSEGTHLEMRQKQYQELKRKRDMPLSERKAEQLQKLREIGKRK